MTGEGRETNDTEHGTGARIIIHEWVRVKAWDKVLIVISKEHQAEAKALEMQARKKARSVNTLIVENKGRHVGIFSTITRRSLIPTLRSLQRPSIRL